MFVGRVSILQCYATVGACTLNNFADLQLLLEEVFKERHLASTLRNALVV